MLRFIFTSHLDIVFFFYGLSFFIMGVLIFSHWRKDSVFELAEILPVLAGFGLTHGINEWLDMVVLIKELPSNSFNTARLVVLYISFIFLFEFGRRLFFSNYKIFFHKWLTVISGAAVVILIFRFTENPGIWPRYFLGFPGGVLAAIGFFLYYKKNKRLLEPFTLRRYFLIASISVGLYAVLSGIVVPKASFFPASVINDASFAGLFGIPVQLIRAICAILLTWAVWKILGIFDLETLYRLQKGIREVTAAKAYVDNIVKSMADSLIVVDAGAQIVEVNNSVCALLGYQKSELIGSPAQKIFGENSPFEEEKNSKLMKTGFLRDDELICLSKNGEKIPVLFSESVMKGPDGELLWVVAVGKDLRELKKIQERLLNSERLAAMGKTASIIGHEFKNKLGVMRNSAYFLKMKLPEPEEKIKKHLAILEMEIIEANAIIENILAFSRTKKPEFASLDIKSFLSAVVSKIEVPEKVKVALQLDNDLPKIPADQAQLTSVFVNIILNSLEAMNSEGELSIRACREDGFVKIVFKDTGIGIKDEEKKNIFEPFFTTKPRGTGLGLTISKTIVEAHDGSIGIESESGKGTAVIIKLPIIRKETDE